MGMPGRRDFLVRGAAVGCALATGVAAPSAVAASWSTEGESREGACAAPPTRSFLERVVAGDLEAVRRGLNADPGLVHVRDAAGRSAFALALLHRHREVAALLRERGHRPDLHESALAVDWERFGELAASTPGMLNLDHPIGGTAMYAAAIGGAGTQIWRVYSPGGEPNMSPRGDRGYTAVRAALEFPDLSVAELTAATLLGNGASPDGPEREGDSALHASARRGSLDLVELLIRKGSDPEAKDARGRTPLQLAEEAGHRVVADRLRRHREIPRDHSSSRRAYDANGEPYRAPDLASFSVGARGTVVGRSHGDLDAVRESVTRHPELAHAVATTTEGAVEAGAHMGRRDIVDFLLERGAPYSLPTAVMCNDLPRARALLDEDPLRIHERGAHDFALLWYPVIGRGLVEMAELLLDRGAEIERQHWLGTTALHFAASRAPAELVELLLKRGGDPNRVGRKFDPAGQTPLQIAQKRERTEIVGLMRAHGGRVSRSDG